MSRRSREKPKAQVSPSVRLGLGSIVEGNEASIRNMLDASASDDYLVEKLIECMGVSNLSAEMLLANWFSASILGEYAERIGKSSKGGVATLAERIAREWAKPSFAPPSSGNKRAAEDEPAAATAAKTAKAASSADASDTTTAAAPATTWKAPSWMELQTDSDDSEGTARAKKQKKKELKAAKPPAAAPASSRSSSTTTAPAAAAAPAAAPAAAAAAPADAAAAPAADTADDDDPPFPLLPITSASTLASIRAMDADARTVFVASYPKSGTTWVQNVVYQLIASAAELDHISNYTPFLEADRTWTAAGAVAEPAASNHARLGWRAFNTHLLPGMLPAAAAAPAHRIVYVVRDPADCCASMWHHFSHMAPDDGGFTGTQAEFVAQWSDGAIAFGTWRRHVGAWLAAAEADPRVLLLSYEAMKADLPACVARVAAHLGLAPSAELTARCLSRVDFAWMKAHEERFAPRSVAWLDKGDGFSFVRRGEVGGAKLDLSAEQREAIERSCWRADDRWSALVGGEGRVLRGIGPLAGA